MPTATPPPPGYQPPPRTDQAEVRHADAETIAHYQRLTELYRNGQDLAEEVAADVQRRQQQAADLERGTVDKNAPTTSQRVDPVNEPSRRDDSRAPGRKRTPKRKR